MAYRIFFTKQAQKDVAELSPKLKTKLKTLLDALSTDPFMGKKLIGELRGSYSLRLSYKDRLVYSVDRDKKEIYIERAKTHYGE